MLFANILFLFGQVSANVDVNIWLGYNYHSGAPVHWIGNFCSDPGVFHLLQLCFDFGQQWKGNSPWDCESKRLDACV